MFRKLFLGSAAALGLALAGIPAADASAGGPPIFRGSPGVHWSQRGHDWNRGYNRHWDNRHWNHGHWNHPHRGYYISPRSSYRSFYGNPYGSFYGRSGFYSPYHGSGMFFGGPGLSFRIGF